MCYYNPKIIILSENRVALCVNPDFSDLPCDAIFSLLGKKRKVMGQTKQNKMAIMPVKKLIWTMGLPMIVSMVLQALYNVVDSVYVANIPEVGAIANQALTLAFPVQIMMIAIGVGTGIGINACLSKSLGEKETEKANRVAGNGIFLALVIYAVFLIFGLFLSKWFISLFSKDEIVVEMGSTYLKICCCLSLGSIGYTVYERFLQATGKTMHSTIAQIAGAVCNIVLDYVFIFPLGMRVAGAAWATIIGQFASLFIAMFFHYFKNKEISGNPKYIKPSWRIVKNIYQIGISAAIMQAMLSVMMAGMNAILTTANANVTVLVGAFGIYYKIQQIALFSAFGLSNTIITTLSFNYGMQDKKRVQGVIKYGIIDTLIVTLALFVLFECIANPLAKLFALSQDSSSELIAVCERATRIGAASFVFMGFTVAVQGVLQAFGYAVKPLVLSVLRLAVFVFPTAYVFTLFDGVCDNVWWTFLIAEVLTDIVSAIFLSGAIKKKVNSISDKAERTGEQDSEFEQNFAREQGLNCEEQTNHATEKTEVQIDEQAEQTFNRIVGQSSNEQDIDAIAK